MKLELNIIAKDEQDQLKRIIWRYQEYFDEIAIAYDDDKVIESINETEKVKLHKYKWIDDFSHKRNWLAERTESEYYLRMDTDDDIGNSENIRVCFKTMLEKGFDCIYVPYIYSRDKDGNVDAEHWRDTFVKKTPNCYWKKAVHENLFIEDQTIFKGAKDDRIQIIHAPKTNEDIVKSSQRNLKILVEEYNRDKEKTDPRTIAYLGRIMAGGGEWDKAIPLLRMLVSVSGWKDDKYFAYCLLGQCYLMTNDYETGIACCNESLALSTEWPDAYLMLCQLYVAKQDYKKAVDWGEIGITKPKPDTLFVIDPTVYGYRARLNLAMAYYGARDYQKALSLMETAHNMAPSHEIVGRQYKVFQEAYQENKFIENILAMTGYMMRTNSGSVEHLVKSVPRMLCKDERIQVLRHKTLPSKTWGDKEVAIFCGSSWEEWGAPSTFKGVGGSEEAVIYIAKEIRKRGYSVTVYNNCGDFEGEYEGVQYKQYYEFNPKDDHNIVIGWRSNIFRTGVKARTRIVWLHDVPVADMFKESELDTFDKVLVLSRYHRSLLPDFIPEQKILISSNGINTDDFKHNGQVRNNKRLIYTSSYDRGIEHLLVMWKDVIAEVPDAELHLYYGWDVYDKMASAGFRDRISKAKLIELMKQPGVFEHGRVGHKQLIKEFMRSGIYAYPCHFEEISCISAMKAQACGCIPITTDYAALAETVKAGVKVEGKAGEEGVNKEYKKLLISCLKDDSWQKEMRKEVLKHKDDFSWSAVAEQWDKELFINAT